MRVRNTVRLSSFFFRSGSIKTVYLFELGNCVICYALDKDDMKIIIV